RARDRVVAGTTIGGPLIQKVAAFRAWLWHNACTTHPFYMRNVRAAIRALTNTPGFSLVAILTLAIGIAATATLFSVYDRLVLNPVTMPEPSSLIAIWSNNPQLAFNAPAVAWPRYVEIERNAKSFSSIANSAFDNFTLTGDGQQPNQLN